MIKIKYNNKNAFEEVAFFRSKNLVTVSTILTQAALLHGNLTE